MWYSLKDATKTKPKLIFRFFLLQKTLEVAKIPNKFVFVLNIITKVTTLEVDKFPYIQHCDMSYIVLITIIIYWLSFAREAKKSMYNKMHDLWQYIDGYKKKN